jgi:hypothetical protein
LDGGTVNATIYVVLADGDVADDGSIVGNVKKSCTDSLGAPTGVLPQDEGYPQSSDGERR